MASIGEPEKELHKTIILLGAGASRPAGVLTIPEMTEAFLNNPLMLRRTFVGKELTNGERNEIKQILQTLSKITQDYHGKNDLEYIMTLLGQLEDPKYREYLKSKYPELGSALSFKGASEDESIEDYKMMIQENIRHFCESITDLKYLWTLDGLVSKPINIFTLNYDGIIEYYCEKNNLTYTDGFDPFWNPDKFKDENNVNLFKLHGSLYWIRPKFGKPFRVPLRRLTISQVRSIDGYSVSEMMLYPKLQKDKQSEVFSWLDRRFKDSLNNADICVIIGYSFRDDEIRNSIIESLSANHKLWLIIVSPHAMLHKSDLSLSREYFMIQNLFLKKILRF